MHRTITRIYSCEYRIRGSRFFGFLGPSESLHELESFIRELRSEYPTASHYCYAARIDPFRTKELISDDGEPSGTAGFPILNQLKSFGLMNTALVVVRYFGGTKLGKAGLIDAYGNSAREAIEIAKLKTLIPCRTFFITYSYSRQSLIDQLTHELDLHEMDAEYREHVSKRYAISEEHFTEAMNRIGTSSHLFEELREEGETWLIV